MNRLALAAALLIAAPVLCHAQSEVEWTQTISTPKGATIPREQADMIGIELGDTYAEAKAKLLKLFEEGIQPRKVQMPVPPFSSVPVVPVKETKSTFRFQAPGASKIVTAGYVSQLRMERQTKGTGSRSIDETLDVFLSAPASGHQVIGIGRSLYYYNESDQPRISELLAQVSAKLKGSPLVEEQTEQGFYTYQFNNGKVVAAPKSKRTDCRPSHELKDASSLPAINQAGDCDAIFHIKIGFGISRDHAKYIYFTLSDNDRTKANLGADFAFVQNYIQKMQEGTRGATPKL